MIIDGRSIAAEHRLAADICIIGAGPIGTTLARSLADDGIQVLLIESGGLKSQSDHQKLNSGYIESGSNHPPVTMYRERRLGGSSTIWGGRCVPFDPIDFEARDYVAHSGWPIGYLEVSKHYAAALQECEAGRFDFSEEALDTDTAFIEGLRSTSTISVDIERYSPPTDFFKRYRKALCFNNSIDLISHSTCIELVSRPDGTQIQEAKFLTLAGNQFLVVARLFVIAAGGLETVRLLASSNRTHTAGLGNTDDQLGRYYMTHIEGTIGNLELAPNCREINWGFDKTSDGIFARRRLRLSDQTQKTFGVRNTIFRLHHSNPVDPHHENGILSLMYFAKSFILPEYRRKITSTELLASSRIEGGMAFWSHHVWNFIRDLPALARFVPYWIYGRHLTYRRLPYVVLPAKNGSYPLDFNAEQEPNPHSRVTLTADTDHIGQRKLFVSWKATENDLFSIEQSYRLLDQELRSQGVGEVRYDRSDLGQLVRRCGPVGGHHIGTARMSDNRKMGVVDTSCRVFDVHNLYVAGAAVFPTCGHANPTLTALALTLRLSYHLKNVLRHHEQCA